MTDKTYFSCAETAKLIRVDLKKAFPGVKFSVRSSVYAGGASIDVSWTDGPSQKAVEGVAKVYAGGGFDGMIDMAYSKDAWMAPDGKVTYGSSEGTEGSMGVVAGYENPAPVAGAKKVRFSSDYVFCTKKWSVPTYTAAVEKVCKDYGVEKPEIHTWNGVEPYIKDHVYVANADTELRTLVHRELAKENYV